MYKVLVVALAFGVVAKCSESDDIYKNCGDSVKCAENNLMSLIDDFDSESSVSLVGDYLILEKTNKEEFMPKAEEDVFERLLRYLCNHELRIRFPSQANARSVIQGNCYFRFFNNNHGNNII